MSANFFAEWQPQYAARGIPTFPVVIAAGRKKPAVKNYMRAGRDYSATLAQRFPDAHAFGFALGARSKVTVLDIDTPDERVLADAMLRHGETPLIVRSGSGNFQGWYRHNGEGRHIRPDKSLPIDILGGGYVIAPPSQGVKNQYQIVSGSLDDLERLPSLQGVEMPADGTKIPTGKRNDALWRECMRQARACDNFDALLDVAQTFNSHSIEAPLSDDEVTRAAKSAWEKTINGQNRFGQHGAYVEMTEAKELITDPCALALLTWLRVQNDPGNDLLIADSLGNVFGWPRRKFKEARSRLLSGGWIRQISKPKPGKLGRPGKAAIYRWDR